jgi:hypothetical protein
MDELSRRWDDGQWKPKVWVEDGWVRYWVLTEWERLALIANGFHLYRGNVYQITDDVNSDGRSLARRIRRGGDNAPWSEWPIP